uniref:Phospholipid scramblase n=1 Tax=Lepeophtheirus salmonis TaxID=72036 RepID=A0A0K2UPB8_LEPSM
MLKENENVTSPITEQPSVDPNSTLGLAPLLNNQSLILKRRMKPFICDCEVDLKYDIHAGNEGEIVYKASEKSNSWQKCCLGSFRAVEININDIANRRVIHIERPLGCFGCCCSILYPFCNAEFMVRVSDIFIGSIRERASWWYPVFHIFDEEGTQIFKVRGPGLVRFAPRKIVFNVTRHLVPFEGLVASITKKWQGLCFENVNLITNYDIEFFSRNTLSLKEKALILSATFLIETTLYAEF